MASCKFFFIVLALCAFQMTPSTAVERRDLLENIFTGAVEGLRKILANILKGAENGITQAETLVANLVKQGQQVLGNSTGPLQNILKGFTDKVQGFVNNSLEYSKNATICVEGQEDYAKNITLQAGENIYTCTQTQIKSATQVLANITSINNQGLALLRTIPGDVGTCIQSGFPAVFQCIVTHTETFSGQILALGASLAQDLGQLGLHVATLPGAIARCGFDQISKATTEVGNLVTDIGNCIENVAKSS